MKEQAKKKAEELIDRFNTLDSNFDYDHTYLHNSHGCALICVDEILGELGVIYLTEIPMNTKGWESIGDKFELYKEVKEQLKQM